MQLADVLGLLADGWLTGSYQKDPKRLNAAVVKLVSALQATLKSKPAPESHLPRVLDLVERMAVVAERWADAGFIVRIGHIPNYYEPGISHAERRQNG